MIPAVSRETTPGGLDTLLEKRYPVEFHAEFGGCGPRDAHLAASPSDRGGSITQRSLQRLLESDGYDVAGAANEAAGLELLRDASPVAVVLELHRRSSCAGRDVFRKIRQGVREIPIIVLGTLLESDTIVLLELGADDYVSRPFPGREVLARVRGASILAYDGDGRLRFR
jgi:CheY-like chemotaxis protein